MPAAPLCTVVRVAVGGQSYAARGADCGAAPGRQQLAPRRLAPQNLGGSELGPPFVPPTDPHWSHSNGSGRRIAGRIGGKHGSSRYLPKLVQTRLKSSITSCPMAFSANHRSFRCLLKHNLTLFLPMTTFIGRRRHKVNVLSSSQDH